MPAGSGNSDRKTGPAVGHNLASRTGELDRKWDGEVYASYNLGFLARPARVRSRAGRYSAAIIFSSSTAEARHYRHRHAARHHHEERESYSPQFSSIIVDANSGATLASTSPDGIRHPASLTKVMTLYLLFERMEANKMTLDTEMPVSEHAAEQDPTKLDLRPGSTLRVEDAIKGVVTKSANDAAVVIAEAIGGDESDFARMMTRKARALGMTRTVYVNASGLPADEQVTTARDQATLARAIQDRFPKYYRYFATEAFNFHGQYHPRP